MVEVRQANLSDIDAIMKVENEWPEYQRASRDKMLSRLRKFPEGFWLFLRQGEVVGMQTSCPIRYEPDAPVGLKNWDAVTNNGYLPDIDLEKANALYVVSGVINQKARGGTTYSLFCDPPVKLAEKMGLQYVLSGAKLPGYDAYCRRHGDIPARDYAFLTLNGCLVDPFLEMLRGFAFTVPDRDHVIPEFYPDRQSRNYGAIVVRKLRP